MLKAEKYIACDVPKDDPVFRDFMVGRDPFSDAPTLSSPISPLSELVGLPFHVRKIPPNPSLPGNDVTNLKDEAVVNRYTNQEATLLLIAMDPRTGNWGFAPSFWQSQVGNVLLTRVDGKVITPQQVEALCAYNFYLLNGPMEAAQEQGEGWDEEEEGEEGEGQVLEYRKVIDKVTPAKFKEYFEYYESIKDREDRKWSLDARPVVMTSSVTASETSGHQGGLATGGLAAKKTGINETSSGYEDEFLDRLRGAWM